MAGQLHDIMDPIFELSGEISGKWGWAFCIEERLLCGEEGFKTLWCAVILLKCNNEIDY